ncbi:hypothetical protein UJ101_02267 [Flavobacteriaceae bacterium UJ101]|nr:hypothetical protein UJ101_02267 [Flavobacteriaceae bacterium UJ101]
MKKHIGIYLRGLAMGAADVVPGVSGGTIAFITGIYDTLLESINNINPSLFTLFKKDGIAAVWKKINGNFLIALIAGIATSILSLAKILHYLMIHHPIPLWAFFFGLIVASIIYVGKEIQSWNISSILGLILGAVFVFYLSIMPPFGSSDSWWYLLLCGIIASCAMILPGISGSFILLLLGAYSVIISAISKLSSLDPEAIRIVALVGMGALIGLASFSRLLKFLLEKFHNSTIAVLTGFLLGSLWKIWPWKTTSEVFVKEKGVLALNDLTTDYQSLTAYLQQNPTIEGIKPYQEDNILPNTYEAVNHIDPNIGLAIVFAILGFGLIFGIEFIAKKLVRSNESF